VHIFFQFVSLVYKTAKHNFIEIKWQGANSTNYDLVIIEFLALPDNEKLKYSELALTDLRQRGLASPTIILHASEHFWNGILLCRMIEIFGDSEYGSEWKMFEQNKINVIF